MMTLDNMIERATDRIDDLGKEIDTLTIDIAGSYDRWLEAKEELRAETAELDRLQLQRRVEAGP